MHQYVTHFYTYKTAYTHTIPHLCIQPSSWRWTFSFETCRRHQKL